MKGTQSVKRALPLLVVSLALAPAAHAQIPTPTPQPTPQPSPPPTTPAAGAALSSKLGSGLSYRGKRYILKGERLVVTGTLKPFVEGQRVAVEVFRKGKRIGRKSTKVLQSGKNGKFRVVLRPRRPGWLGIRAVHKANKKQKAAKSTKLFAYSIRPSAHVGSSGAKVRLLQHALARLHYVTSHGGYFDDATGRALIAYRKVSGYARTTSANRKIYRRLFNGKGGYKLRYPSAGRHVEFDWSRQVLVLADNGAPERIYHASSGKPSTPTVFGTFRFYRKSPGTNAEGMVDSNYFIRGYAIHGYASVPTYAASHGCIRVPVPVAASIYNWISLGETIYVYR